MIALTLTVEARQIVKKLATDAPSRLMVYGVFYAVTIGSLAFTEYFAIQDLVGHNQPKAVETFAVYAISFSIGLAVLSPAIDVASAAFAPLFAAMMVWAPIQNAKIGHLDRQITEAYAKQWRLLKASEHAARETVMFQESVRVGLDSMRQQALQVKSPAHQAEMQKLIEEFESKVRVPTAAESDMQLADIARRKADHIERCDAYRLQSGVMKADRRSAKGRARAELSAAHRQLLADRVDLVYASNADATRALESQQATLAESQSEAAKSRP